MLCAGLPAASNQPCSTAWAIAASTAASSWPIAGPINRTLRHCNGLPPVARASSTHNARTVLFRSSRASIADNCSRVAPAAEYPTPEARIKMAHHPLSHLFLDAGRTIPLPFEHQGLPHTCLIAPRLQNSVMRITCPKLHFQKGLDAASRGQAGAWLSSAETIWAGGQLSRSRTLGSQFNAGNRRISRYISCAIAQSL